MKNIVIFLACLLPIFSASCQSRERVYSKIVTERCAKDRSNCSKDCQGKTFRYCYYYPEKLNKPQFDIRTDCLGLHVGKSCSPCEDIYTLNFGAALQQVSCEEFYSSLYARDKECNSCIKKGEFPG